MPPNILTDALARRRRLLSLDRRVGALDYDDATDSIPSLAGERERFFRRDRAGGGGADVPPLAAAPAPPPDPAQDPYEGDLKRLDALRNISEGFGGIGDATLEGDRIRLAARGIRLPEVQPYTAEGLRGRRNEILKEREHARGLKEGLASEERQRTFASTEAEKKRTFEAAQSDKQQTRLREGMGETERHNKAMESKSGMARPRLMPGMQIDQLAGAQTTVEMLDEAQRLYNRAAAKLGPVESRVQSAWRKLSGSADPDFRRLESHLDQIVSQYLFTVSGKAATDVERKAIKDQLMTKIDSPETFTAALEQFKHNVQGRRSNLLGTLTQAGYEAGGFQGQPATGAPASRSSAGPPGTKRVTFTDGSSEYFSEEQLQKLSPELKKAIKAVE